MPNMSLSSSSLESEEEREESVMSLSLNAYSGGTPNNFCLKSDLSIVYHLEKQDYSPKNNTEKQKKKKNKQTKNMPTTLH